MRGKPIFFDPTDKRARLLQGLGMGRRHRQRRHFSTVYGDPCGRESAKDKSLDQELSAQTSIRCAWAQTCSPAQVWFP